MKSKTNLGGAISITGTTLIGIGVLTQLAQFAPNTNVPPSLLAAMWYVALAGFIISALGKGVTAYFAADAKDVQEVEAKINNVAQSVDTINQTGTDSTAQPSAQNKTNP
jgi:hypothetical protein